LVLVAGTVNVGTAEGAEIDALFEETQVVEQFE
jgi:hypothetical protein